MILIVERWLKTIELQLSLLDSFDNPCHRHQKYYGLIVCPITQKQQSQPQLVPMSIEKPNTETESKQHGESRSTHSDPMTVLWPLYLCVCVSERGRWEVGQFSWPASEKKLSDTQQTNRQQQLLSELTTLSEDIFRHAKYILHFILSLITWTINFFFFYWYVVIQLVLVWFVQVLRDPSLVFPCRRFSLDLTSCKEIVTLKTADSELSSLTGHSPRRGMPLLIFFLNALFSMLPAL